MNKVFKIIPGIILLLFMSGCTTTFAGTIFIITFKDIIYYIMFSFILAIIIGTQSDNKRQGFWLWFILNLLLTPLSGFIYLLVKISTRI
jgi:hypothetical protein